jgi:hypothetical protein
MMWSSTSTPSSAPASTRRRVNWTSSALGLGSPLGWLCVLCARNRYAWPMGAADHTGRHVDRSHITDWLRWGCLRLCWTERRLSWWAISFVPRSSIHQARSARADCGPPVNPISCAARRRIRAIENCVSRLFSVARSTTSDDVGSTCRQIESNQSPRYTAAAARVLCYRVRPISLCRHARMTERGRFREGRRPPQFRGLRVRDHRRRNHARHRDPPENSAGLLDLDAPARLSVS